MMIHSGRASLTALLAFVFASFGPVPSARAADPYALIPAQADQGLPFGAMLAASRFTCNYDFKGDTAIVYQNEVRLAFVAEPNPLVKCASTVAANGPSFVIPALKSGTYAVYAQPMPACALSSHPCPFAMMRIFVDSLRVHPDSAMSKDEWFIKPREAEAGPDLELQLLNWAFASCQNSFSNVTWELRQGAIHLDYQVSYLKRLCSNPVRPYGMILPLDTLKPGRYPVYVRRNLCDPTLQDCAVAAETLVDTLRLRAATAVAPRPRTPGGTAEGFSLRAPWDLDASARIEVYSCRGRKAAELIPERIAAGEVFSLPRTGLAPGVYLLRLTAPGRAPERRTAFLP
jgi:hypothetical protein